MVTLMAAYDALSLNICGLMFIFNYMLRNLFKFSSRAQRLEENLFTIFKPIHLQVIDESKSHSRGAETHYKVVVVSDMFDQKSRIERQRMVNEVLRNEFNNGMHALSVVSKTPQEWNLNKEVSDSPKCRGASKKEQKT